MCSYGISVIEYVFMGNCHSPKNEGFASCTVCVCVLFEDESNAFISLLPHSVVVNEKKLIRPFTGPSASNLSKLTTFAFPSILKLQTSATLVLLFCKSWPTSAEQFIDGQTPKYISLLFKQLVYFALSYLHIFPKSHLHSDIQTKLVKKVMGLRGTDWWLQNSHGTIKHSRGNIVNDIVISMYGARRVLKLSGKTLCKEYDVLTSMLYTWN